MSLRSLGSALVCSLATAIGLAACSGGTTGVATTQGGKPIVVTTIFSYYDAARAIAGDKLDVEILLPPGQSPHEYDPSFEDKMKVSKAKLLVWNGLGLDDRFAKLIDPAAGTKSLEISKALPGNEVLSADEVGLGGKASGESTLVNPHIWLDPMIQMEAAEKIKDKMIEIDPADQSSFETNAKTYEDALRTLDAEFKAAVATFKTKEFIGFHSAYEYLARRYGLQQIASIEELPGEGITPAQAQKIIDLIKKNNIKYVAKETAFNEKGADAIVRETGVQLITLQPLETYDDAKESYVSLMRQNLAALRTALGQ